MKLIKVTELSQDDYDLISDATSSYIELETGMLLSLDEWLFLSLADKLEHSYKIEIVTI